MISKTTHLKYCQQVVIFATGNTEVEDIGVCITMAVEHVLALLLLLLLSLIFLFYRFIILLTFPPLTKELRTQL